MHKCNVVGKLSNNEGKAVGIRTSVKAVLANKSVNTATTSSATSANISGQSIPRRLKFSLFCTIARSRDVSGRRDLGAIILSNTCGVSMERIFPSATGALPLLLLCMVPTRMYDDGLHNVEGQFVTGS